MEVIPVTKMPKRNVNITASIIKEKPRYTFEPLKPYIDEITKRQHERKQKNISEV